MPSLNFENPRDNGATEKPTQNQVNNTLFSLTNYKAVNIHSNEMFATVSYVPKC
jgi:hypothetical protein